MSGWPDGLRLRRAGPGDAAAVAGISIRGWRATYRGMVPDTILDNMDPVRRERGWARLIASDEGSRIDLAELDGRVVGFVASGPAGDHDVPPTAGEVIAIYVDPDLLRIGIGRALLDHAAALLRAAGRSPLVLWVLTANVDGRRFYESLGWQADGAARPIDFAGTPVEEVRYRST